MNWLDTQTKELLQKARNEKPAPSKTAEFALVLLRKAGIVPQAVAVAMEQGQLWRNALAEHDPAWPTLVAGVFTSPLLRKGAGGWMPG